MASGINSTFRQVGIATGIAGLGAIFQHSVIKSTSAALHASGHAREILGAAHGQLGTLLESGNVGQIAGTLSPSAHTALIDILSSWLHRRVYRHPDRRRRAGPRRLVLAFVLVRGRDFVSAGEVPAAQETEPVAVAAG